MITMRCFYGFPYDKANQISSRRLLLMRVPATGGAFVIGTQDWVRSPTDFRYDRELLMEAY